MIPTPEQREDQFQKGTPVQCYLFESDEIGLALEKIGDDYHLPAEVRREYILAFSDVALGFFPEQDMPKLLMERMHLSEKLASVIAHDLLELINETKLKFAKTAPQVAESAPAPAVPAQAVPPPAPEARPMEMPKEKPIPAWTKHITEPPAAPAPKPITPPAPEPAPEQPLYGRPPQSGAPSYRTPLTDTPTYGAPPNLPRGKDPYREPL